MSNVNCQTVLVIDEVSSIDLASVPIEENYA